VWREEKTADHVPPDEDSRRETFAAGRLAVSGRDPRRSGRDILLCRSVDIGPVGSDRSTLHRGVMPNKHPLIEK